jgi:hypothetical protein
MAKMHLCTCFIALGGDTRNIVFKNESNAVSFPEINVLKAIHGAEAVHKIQAVGSVDTDPVREKARLVAIYGGDIVEKLYPGFAPLIQLTFPQATDEAVQKKKEDLEAAGKKVKVAAHADADDI